MSRNDPTYNRVSSRFWAEARAEDWTDDMALLAAYILTCDHRTTEGIYHLPREYMIADLPDGWDMARLDASLDALVSLDFLRYDYKARVVFLPKAMKYQRPDTTQQQTAAIRNLMNLPKTHLMQDFIRACEAFARPFHRALIQALEQASPQGKRQASPQGKRQAHTRARARATQAPAQALKEPPLPPQPVENDKDSSGPEERECLADTKVPHPDPQLREVGPTLTSWSKWPTCDGQTCRVRDLRCSLRGVISQIVGPADAGKLYAEDAPLHKELSGMVGYICDAAQRASAAPGVEQSDRLPVCERVVRQYVDGLLAFHRAKPIRSLPAFLRSRYAHMTEPPISDGMLAELRALERREVERESEGDSSVRRLADVLPRANGTREEAAS